MRGFTTHIPSTAWRAVHRERLCVKANQVQPSRLLRIASIISEGILSFVEYAPRLLIVLPSRQFFVFDISLITDNTKRTEIFVHSVASVFKLTSVRSQISVVIYSEHRLHRFKGLSRLRSGLTSSNSVRTH